MLRSLGFLLGCLMLLAPARMRAAGLQPDRGAAGLVADRVEGNLLAAARDLPTALVPGGVTLPAGQTGEQDLEDALDNSRARTLLQLDPFNQIGTPMEIARAFGGPQQYLQAVRQLEREIYRTAA